MGNARTGAWFPFRLALGRKHLVTVSLCGVLGLASPAGFMAVTGQLVPAPVWLAVTGLVPWAVALWLVPERAPSRGDAPSPPDIPR